MEEEAEGIECPHCGIICGWEDHKPNCIILLSEDEISDEA